MCAFVRAAVGDVGKKRAVERKICGETTERRERGTRGGVFFGGNGFFAVASFVERSRGRGAAPWFLSSGGAVGAVALRDKKSRSRRNGLKTLKRERFQLENVENEVFAFVEAARRRIVVLPSRVEHLKAHRRRLARRVAEVVLVVAVRIVLEARPILEFAGRNRVRGRSDDVANVQAIFKVRAETVRTFGPTGAQTADATRETDDAVRDGETGTDDGAFAFVANVGRLNRRLSLNRDDVLSVNGGGNESKRGGDQKTREKVVFHLLLLKNTGAASR